MTRKESDIQTDILDWLNAQQGCAAWLFSAGSTSRRRKKHRPAGLPDIVGIFRGTFLAVEVKATWGVVSEQQERVIAKIREMGGLAVIARSVADVRDVLPRQAPRLCQSDFEKRQSREGL